LLLWRHPHSGETRIVFEELLLSRPGWDEQSAAEGLSYPALARAATVEEMTTALRAIDVDVHQVVAVPADLDDPFRLGLLLQATIALGPLDCLEKITYTQCGEESEDWGLVEGAKLDHPCVRRALVMSLLGDPLPADALDAVAPAEHAVKLTEIHRQSALPTELMLPVVAALAAKPQRALLAVVAASDDCDLAMAAASALAGLGDASRLPRWQTATDSVAAQRVVCLLRHDPDRARALLELEKFFHAKRAVRRASLRLVENDFATVRMDRLPLLSCA